MSTSDGNIEGVLDQLKATGRDARPLRVLAVDDDPAILTVLKRLIRMAGHMAFTAGDGAEALTCLSEVFPDIVITDWQMPVMDGIELCRALRKTDVGRDVHVLMLTSIEDEERIVEAFEAGVDEYMRKPFSQSALTARLRDVQQTLQMQEELKQGS